MASMPTAPVRIRLIGRPEMQRHGLSASPPRGRKAWALLSCLLLNDHPVSRRHAAELLFGEANDPLGALRWTLAELRRAIELPRMLSGDPIVVGLESVWVDALALDSEAAEAMSHMTGELLDGLSIDGCPVFESWLVVERYRISAAIEARLRDEAARLMVVGRHLEAVQFASQVVRRNVLDESNHELLVRCLAAAGDEAGALRQLTLCEELFERELGVKPSLALRDAARCRPHPAFLVSLGSSAEVLSLLGSGRAAVGAGAVAAGLDCFQRAVAKAAPLDDQALHGRALLGLGSALVHGVRGRDGEGSIVLHDALRLAERMGDDHTMAIACRELGYVDVQAGRRLTATKWLERAAVLADEDELRAAVLGVQGMNESDAGRYARARTLLDRSVTTAEACDDQRQRAWSLSILGRLHVLRGELALARDAVEQSLEIVRDLRWMAFLPWPQALKAELDLLADEPTDQTEVEQAWALSCHLGDPCWEALTARALALMSVRRGDAATATRWLDEAARRCNEANDTYQWVRVCVMDTTAQVTLDAHHGKSARPIVEALANLAARCEMGEYVVRAQLHRVRLGEPVALDTARLLGEMIDNPALHLRIAQAAKGDFA
jgi:DNA-binding SARP family transcriptional activator